MVNDTSTKKGALDSDVGNSHDIDKDLKRALSGQHSLTNNSNVVIIDGN